MKKAIFPGSFNPIHLSHIDIIREAIDQYDVLYVVVANNEVKNYVISIDKRVEIVENVLKGEFDSNKIKVVGLTKGEIVPDFALKHNVRHIIRGLRGQESKSITKYEDKLSEWYLEYNENLIFHYILTATKISSTEILDMIRRKSDVTEYLSKHHYKDILIKYSNLSGKS